MKLLVIDNNKDFILLLQVISKKNNITMDYVYDCMTGCKKHYENHYDIILLDYNLDGAKGIDFLKCKGDSKVILCSGSYIEVNGVDGFIQKPFSPKELIKLIKTLWDVEKENQENN